jgi:hypothetical protein
VESCAFRAQAAICPLLGCGTKARHRLNAINAFQYLWADKARSHLLVCRAHKGHPAVPLLIQRFEAAKANSRMTPAQLDEVAPNPLTSEWMAEHADEIGSDGLRTIASLETTRDLFDANLSTPLARGTWMRQAKEAYDQLLEQRKAAREASAQADADTSRARAVAAMGLLTEAELESIAYNEREQHRGEALFAELQSLDPDADEDDYSDENGWDIKGIEGDITVSRRGARAPA